MPRMPASVCSVAGLRLCGLAALDIVPKVRAYVDYLLHNSFPMVYTTGKL